MGHLLYDDKAKTKIEKEYALLIETNQDVVPALLSVAHPFFTALRFRLRPLLL